MTPHSLALPAVIAGAVAIGCSPILVRLSEIGPMATGVHRLLWALPIYLIWMRASPDQRPVGDRRAVLAVGLAGLLFAGDLAFWHLSILHTTVANATLFANFAPVIVTLGAWLVLGERITRRFVLGLALGLGGAASLVGASLDLNPDHVRGDILGMITAFFFGTYLVTVTRIRRRVAPAAILFWSGLITCLALVPLAWINGESLLPPSASALLPLIALAWLSQAAGQGLIAWGVGHLPASFSSLVILVEPLTAAILGWVVLGEALGALQYLGGALVLAGIWVARERQGEAP